jgi:hypothetical protein
VADKERLSVDEVQRISHFRAQIHYAIEQGIKSATLGINLDTRAPAQRFLRKSPSPADISFVQSRFISTSPLCNANQSFLWITIIATERVKDP